MEMVPRRVLAAALAVVYLVTSSTAAAQTFPNAFPSAVPVPTPEAAVQEAVQAANQVYAGDCAAATPANGGQVCSKYVADRGQLSAYLIGLTFSEYTRWVFVQQTPEGWLPLSTAILDDSATSVTVPWPAG
jgi:hypothetical protein